MSIEGKVVFLVDDDYDYLYQIKFQLERWGCKVVAAESQKEAEELLENLKPDLAILDLMMENEDSGFILSYKMKRKYPDVPVVITTAVSSETGMSFGIHEGEDMGWIKADVYLEKGMHPENLKKELEKLIK